MNHSLSATFHDDRNDLWESRILSVEMDQRGVFTADMDAPGHDVLWILNRVAEKFELLAALDATEDRNDYYALLDACDDFEGQGGLWNIKPDFVWDATAYAYFREALDYLSAAHPDGLISTGTSPAVAAKRVELAERETTLEAGGEPEAPTGDPRSIPALHSPSVSR
ncbi:hypothetical protein ACWG8W_06315 [Citricoccus zhacaiensis]